MNEPVAIRYDFDGYGYQYMDSGSGSDWQTRVEGELLYADPVKELPTKDDEYWLMVEVLRAKVKEQQAEIEALKQQLVTTSSEAKLNYNKGHEDGRKLATVKELTDEEIISTMVQFDVYSTDDHCLIEAGRAILRKAQEK